MVTIEQINSEKDELKILLKDISGYTPEMLLRQDIDKLNFEKGLPIFKKFLDLYHDLSLCDLDNIPFETLGGIKPKAKDTLAGINAIINFTPSKHTNPEQERDKIIEESQKSYPEHWKIISPIIAYSIRKGIDYESLVQKTKENIIHQEKMNKELDSLRENTTKEADEILKKIRKAAAEAGVPQHAIAFKEAADEYDKKSKIWLWATIVWAVVIVLCGAGLIGLHLFKWETIPEKTAEAIHYSIPKLIIFSTLYFALVWSAKNYNTNRHNYIVNKHRHNALQTFELFIEAAKSDPATKNAVILQTTQSIFSSQPSGYVHKDSESESPFKILEFIRTVGGKGQT
ncbi:MAG: hypothetical protein HY096_00800 [Nitrospinae bacterium]|nr:hypothetical protein [Nitrospinota bacterium]